MQSHCAGQDMRTCIGPIIYSKQSVKEQLKLIETDILNNQTNSNLILIWSKQVVVNIFRRRYNIKPGITIKIYMKLRQETKTGNNRYIMTPTQVVTFISKELMFDWISRVLDITIKITRKYPRAIWSEQQFIEQIIMNDMKLNELLQETLTKYTNQLSNNSFITVKQQIRNIALFKNNNGINNNNKIVAIDLDFDNELIQSLCDRFYKTDTIFNSQMQDLKNYIDSNKLNGKVQFCRALRRICGMAAGPACILYKKLKLIDNNSNSNSNELVEKFQLELQQERSECIDKMRLICQVNHVKCFCWNSKNELKVFLIDELMLKLSTIDEHLDDIWSENDPNNKWIAFALRNDMYLHRRLPSEYIYVRTTIDEIYFECDAYHVLSPAMIVSLCENHSNQTYNVCTKPEILLIIGYIRRLNMNNLFVFSEIEHIIFVYYFIANKMKLSLFIKNVQQISFTKMQIMQCLLKST